ncbi:MAG: VanW family protein [Lachnospiraceae bacterium]|nr:VanW family protein [Candidatus Merdinaster equi]
MKRLVNKLTLMSFVALLIVTASMAFVSNQANAQGEGSVVYTGTIAQRGREIPSGVYAGHIDISGMNDSEIKSAVEEYVNTRSQSILVFTDAEGNGYEIPVNSLNLCWTNSQIADEAGGLLENENALERYISRTDLNRTHKVYSIDLSYDNTALKTQLEEIAANLASEYTNATLTRENGEFVVVPGEAGYGMDVDSTIINVDEVLLGGANTQLISVDLAMGIVEPDWSESDLAKVKDLLGTFTTSYKSSGSSRCSNIANACSKVNGTVLMPGEEFSTLATITPFTIANGYKEAGSYAGGKVVQSIGGGICQVSSTLYNAVLLSELEVTNRRNHAMMVDYVKVGMDATVSNDSGVDFTFVNSTNYPIYIEGFTEGKTITISIYGVEERSESHQVSYETTIVSKTPPEGEKCYADPSQPAGYIETQPAHTGYEADVYKIITEDGVEVSRELMTHSKYKKTDKYAIVGTATNNPVVYNALMNAIATNSIGTVRSVIKQLQAGTYTQPTPVPVAPVIDPATIPPVDPAVVPAVPVSPDTPG